VNFSRQALARAAGSKIPFQVFIPRRFFHPLKPASEFPSFLFRQMFDRFLDGFERQTFNVAYTTGLLAAQAALHRRGRPLHIRLRRLPI
jgi:hypothetical protein